MHIYGVLAKKISANKMNLNLYNKNGAWIHRVILRSSYISLNLSSTRVSSVVVGFQ